MKRAIWTVILAALPHTAHAYIERMYSFKEVLEESTNVFIGKMERVDRKNRIAVARIDKALKGDGEYQQVQMNLSVGVQLESRYLIEVLREGEPFIIFYCRNGNEIAALAHSCDVWFQLHAGHQRDTNRVWWQFTHIEIYFWRTFDGTTVDLIQLAGDVLAGRRKPPAPNPRVPKFDVRTGPRPGARRVAGEKKSLALVPRNAVWRYRKGTAEPAPPGEDGGWKSAGFDDHDWESGKGAFGYGEGDFGTALPDMRRNGEGGGYSTLYLRGSVEVPEPAAIRDLAFGVDYDDGFILWLNGKKAFSSNEPAGEPAHDSLAAGRHESGVYESFTLEKPEGYLVKGKNVVAIQVFNRALTSSDLKFDLEASASLQQASKGFRQVFEVNAPGESQVRGISWVDVDRDGRLDAFFCRSAGNLLLLNLSGGWSEAPHEFGWGEGSRSAGWADCDGDGRPDLLTSGFRILQGKSGRASRDAGLPPPPARNPEGAGWIDYDGDGLPDALITSGRQGIFLYRNRGEEPGRFLDVSGKAGLGPEGLGNGNGDFVAFADYDLDGYTDFLYNLQGGILAHNTGGAFVNDAGTGIELPGGSAWKRGAVFADYDNDLDLDLFVPSPETPRLYRNNNDGTFTDVTDRSGDLAESASPSFSGAWGDVNHDGFLDLLVCYSRDPPRIYLGDRKGKFHARDDLLPADWTAVQAASFADADGDGDLDLAVNLDSGAAVALNEVPKEPGRGAVRVQVQVRKGLVGAVVRAYDSGWRRLALRQLALAEGCGGQGPPVAHFALPPGASHLTVCLSDGRSARKTVEVTERGMVVTFKEEEMED